MILVSVPGIGQITIDTVAGGHILSGVSAQNVAFGVIDGVTRDPAGNVVFCENSTNVIRRINADGTIQTIAGKGIPGYGGDGGLATSALLNGPAYPKYDSSGNLYFADVANFRIRRIDSSGTITTVAGTGIQGTLGTGGPAAEAEVSHVLDLAVDKSGYVYIGEAGDVRRITPSGLIEMYAGCADCYGEMDGAPATNVSLSVWALATDLAGNLYISDWSHILRVSPDGILHLFCRIWPVLNDDGKWRASAERSTERISTACHGFAFCILPSVFWLLTSL